MAGAGAQVNCRKECAIPANDKQDLVGGYLAWIMSAEEDSEVKAMVGAANHQAAHGSGPSSPRSYSDGILRESRFTRGSTQAWEVIP